MPISCSRTVTKSFRLTGSCGFGCNALHSILLLVLYRAFVQPPVLRLCLSSLSTDVKAFESCPKTARHRRSHRRRQQRQRTRLPRRRQPLCCRIRAAAAPAAASGGSPTGSKSTLKPVRANRNSSSCTGTPPFGSFQSLSARPLLRPLFFRSLRFVHLYRQASSRRRSGRRWEDSWGWPCSGPAVGTGRRPWRRGSGWRSGRPTNGSRPLRRRLRAVAC
jgi:hypothetical protein